MTDTDPEHEVGDVKAPEHPIGHPPDADARRNEISQTTADANHGDEGGRDEQQPPQKRLPIFQNAADALGDPVVGTPAEDELFALKHRELHSRVGLRCCMNGGCHGGVNAEILKLDHVDGCLADELGVRHFRIRILDACQVTGPRNSADVVEKIVVPGDVLGAAHHGFISVE